MVDVKTRSVGALVQDPSARYAFSNGAMDAALSKLSRSSTSTLESLHRLYTDPVQFQSASEAPSVVQDVLSQGHTMPAPMDVLPQMAEVTGALYAGGTVAWFDLAPRSADPELDEMLRPLQEMAGKAEHAIRKNPILRMQFESLVGGRVVDFGDEDDGKMKIQRFGGGYMGNMTMFSPYASHIFGHLGSMDAGATQTFGSAAMDAYSGDPFHAFMMGGLGHVAGFEPGANRAANYGSQGVSGYGWSPTDNSGPLGGRRFGSWNPFAMPGHINNTNPHYEKRHQAEAAAILADPSLTVEDQVVLLLMLIMKKADDDIKRQTQYINSVQQQQARGPDQTGWDGSGGVLGNPMGGGNDSPSIDVETMKLSRMVEKRGQMFDTLRQIIDRYNQTAKSMIESIGR